MKKISNFVLIFLILSCVCVGIFLVSRKIVYNLEQGKLTNASGDDALSVNVLERIEMLEGTVKCFLFDVNYSSATIEISVEDESVAIIDSSNNIFALNCGNTNCNVVATYGDEVVTKTTQIVVCAKDITFSELNQANFNGYKSGKKFDNTYDNYCLQISANFDLSESVLSLDDNILITNTIFSNEKQNVLIQYNLLNEGKFEFLIDGYSFSKTATNYISSLDLDFLNVEIVESKIKLYNLINEKETAYQDGKYDYAQLSKLENFEVIIENENIVSYDNLIFNAKSVGQTNVIFKATDGSDFELNLTIMVEEIYATTCQININEEISIIIGENFLVEISNFLPAYSTIKNITLTTSENLSVNDMTISSVAVGNGWFKVFLNGTLIKEIQVNVGDIPDEVTNYSISIISPEEISVDMDNKIIYLPLGIVQLRVYIYDEENNFALVNVQIINGNSSASIEGNTLTINSVDNSVLRITNEDNDTFYDFSLVIL